MWARPNTFETLVHIILEQQVSLASAFAALTKLKVRLPTLTPEAFLSLSDEELKACYFSQQKITYGRHLAHALASGKLHLTDLETMSNEEVRSHLIQLKGIGHWTIDIYLMFVLQRMDIFPLGDLAAISSLKQLKGLPKETTHESMLDIVRLWQPYRTVATYLLWHFYLSERKKP
jgi:DNA-3-methyladenine glycosylase II